MGGDTHTIDIGEGENSLTGVMEAINAADVGVRAAIINDGTVNPDGSSTPFRMVLTGETVAKEFSLDASGLTGGASLDLGTPVQQATRAHVRVDNIDIYSDTNTLTEAIPGMTPAPGPVTTAGETWSSVTTTPRQRTRPATGWTRSATRRTRPATRWTRLAHRMIPAPRTP